MQVCLVLLIFLYLVLLIYMHQNAKYKKYISLAHIELHIGGALHAYFPQIRMKSSEGFN